MSRGDLEVLDVVLFADPFGARMLVASRVNRLRRASRLKRLEREGEAKEKTGTFVGSRF